jgi:hypothetical protein
MFCYAIASEQLPFVIASLITIRRSNLLKTLNTKGNVQCGDCFTPTHLPTLRFAMTDCCKRLLRRFAPRNDEKGRHCERILPFVIASLITIRRSNLLISHDTKGNVQCGDCFTPTHLPTLAVRNDGLL